LPVDYFAEVRISVGNDLIFTGAVLECVPESGDVRINCGAAPALEELVLPPLAVRDIPAADMIYFTLRSIGWPEERMSLHGLDQLPFEPFEVRAPIEGVSLDQEAMIGGIRLVPGEAAGDPLRNLGSALENDEAQNLASAFRADAYAVALEPAARTFDAEHAALRSIDVALGWLNARTRYGLARAPNGDAMSFRRVRALARPRRGNVAYTRGLETGRQLIRLLGPSLPPASLTEQEFDFSSERLPPNVSFQDEQAILACRRAVEEEDPLARVTALWEAIEFYTAGSRARRLFRPEELTWVEKTVANSLPQDALTSEQQARVRHVLRELNSPPLLTRLRAALDRDGVPVSGGDIALLQRLRRLRNDAVHGRSTELPTNEELAHAISIVGRMLLFRLARLRADTGG
jgi:hypothetical protein